MQVAVLKEEGLSRELEVTIPASLIAQRIDMELTEYGKKAKIDGFRKGKIPLPVLKKQYGKMILGEVIDKTIQESAANAMKEKEIRPAMQPKIELKDGEKFDEGKDLIYTMKVEVLPTFKVMDLSKVAVEKPVAKVEDKVVEETLERIASNNRTFAKVEEARAAAMGDICVVDFTGTTKDGVSLPGMSGKGMNVELGSGQLIPGFEDQLVGKKVGDHVEVDVTFPEDYGVAELAGKPTIFHVDITELQTPSETKIDDELAKKLNFDDLGALKEAVVKEVSKDYEQLSRLRLKRSLLDVLDENHSFELPETMVKMEYDAIVRQMEQEKKQAGEEITDADKDELKPIAERRVRLGLVLAEIGRENNVQVSQEELYKAIYAEARKFPGQEQQVLEFYSKNPQVIESFRAPIYEDKVVDYILTKATVSEKEVSLDDLTAEEEDGDVAAKKPAKKKATAKKKE
ncbi:MAG: trigger factor [Pseudobdellovibrionaceae bacterium]|jgi:trigger factor|nr:trigger factor [Pseudobdellovibrionaceae bacterium]